MTFNECFVYITLPNCTEAVTAGKFRLMKERNGIFVGHFVYGKSYLERSDAIEIDPIELKLTEEQYDTVLLNGVFGALRDSSPDYWGRHLIELHCGYNISSEMDYLLNSPDDRIGALGFGLNKTPPALMRSFNKRIQLAQLQEEAQKIISNNDALSDTQIKELLMIEMSTSMGGARPKAVIEDEDNLWLAKFNSPKDLWNNARVEHAMLKLAQLCGIESSYSKLISVADQDVLLLKRFDREKSETGYFRHRMVSALTLLKADDDVLKREKWSYISMAENLRKISCDTKKDLEQLFRRMVFNALITNNDDHLRNHAFIAKNKGWQLSPAYDLTPTPMISTTRDLALVCGKYGRLANKRNLLSECGSFLLNRSDAEKIVDDMQTKVKNSWYATVRAEGVTEKDCEKIKTAFVCEGFNDENEKS
jgi:serine/threonine-protein kinase HipA